MKKSHYILLLLLFSFVNLNAQNDYTRTLRNDTLSIDTTTSRSNWFISISGGGSRLLAEDALKLPFFKEMRPSFSLSTGTWITPVWGVRFDLTYTQSRGFALWSEGKTEGDPGHSGGYWYLGKNYPSPAKGSAKEKFNTYLPAYDLDPDVRSYIKNTFFDLDRPRTSNGGGHQGYNYSFRHFSSMIEVLMNLNNAFQEPDCDRFFTLIPFGGVGWVHTIKEKNRSAVNSIGAKAGILANFRLNKRFDLYLESNMLVAPEVLDRYVGDNETQDMAFNLMGGISYKFGSTNGLCRSCRNSNVDLLNKKINDLQAQVLILSKRPESCPEIPECLNVNINGTVKDNNGNPLPGATIFVLNSENKSVTTLLSDSQGKYSTLVPCGAPLIIKAVKGGYSEQCISYESPSERTGKTVYRNMQDLQLEKFKLGQIFKVENIYYDFDKWNIRPDAAIELDKVARFLTENPQIKVELGSHTDSRGSAKYNETLSQRRAEAAVNYIYIEHGIDKSRITAKGYGERVLVNKCKDGIKCTDEQHQENRRTELKITGFIKPEVQKADPWTKYKVGQLYKDSDFSVGFFSNCK